MFFFSVGFASNLKIRKKKLDQGLFLFEYFLSKSVNNKNSDIVILQIDPENYSFKLLSASENKDQSQPVKDWVEKYNLIAGINASMFWEDQQTSAGYMRDYNHINNNNIHPKYGAFLVFNPKDSDLAKIKIVDKANEPNWKSVIQKYSTVIQNYRMISIKQKNVWEQNPTKHSVAAIGMDEKGNMLFILSRLFRSTYDLNNILLDLPINITSCVFVEGGPSAGMYVKTEDFEKGWYGVSEATLYSETPSTFLKIPNIIGVTRIK